MAVKTIELTRNIRDRIYNEVKKMSKEEQIRFYREKATELNKKLQQTKKSPV